MRSPSLQLVRPGAFLALLALLTPIAGGATPATSAPLDERLRAAIVDGFTAARVAPPQLDPALARAAAALAKDAHAAKRAAAATEEEVLRRRLREARVHDMGVVPLVFRGNEPEALRERLTERTRALAASTDEPPDRVGIGSVQDEQSISLVVLFARRRALLEPIPSRVEVPSVHDIRGALLGPLSRPELFVTPPGGAPVRLPTRIEGKQFSARISFAAQGLYGIEVIGHGPRGPTVAVLREIWAGAQDEARRAPTPRPVPEPTSPAAQEALILDEVNTLREARGLVPLAADETLQNVARSYAAELARTGRFAHRSNESGSLTDRLRKAGYPFARAGENLAQAPTATGAHRSTVKSPGHLRNLLEPAWSRAGIGVAHTRAPGGDVSLIVVEIFVLPPPRPRP